MALSGNPVVLGGGMFLASGGVTPVSGPGSSTDNAIARWNGTSGDLLENSGVTIDDNNIGTAPRTALGTTSSDGWVLTNTTAATGAVTVQISPRLRLRGNAWDTSASQTVDFFIENLPVTAATPTGTFKVGYSLNGGAVTYPMTLSSAGTLTTLAQLIAGTNVQVGSTGIFYWNSRAAFSSSAAFKAKLTDTSNAAGVTLDASTDGTLKVRNFADSADAAITALSLTTGSSAWIFGAASAGAPTADSKIRVTIGGTAYDIAAAAA